MDAVQAVTRMFSDRLTTGRPNPVPADYCIDNTADRVVSLILGTARLSNGWDGIRANDIGA
jgi:UDP-N-acetylglucosamine 2-epimerase (non-hydrolysing)